MVDVSFDESALFANFNDEPSEEINILRKHLNKDKGKDKKVENAKDEVENTQTKYISELEEQNSKLKGIIKRMLGPQAFSFNDNQTSDDGGEIDLIKKLDDNIQSKPFAIVLFLNNDMSTVHRKEIEDMMKSISEKDARQDVLLAQKLQAQNSAVPLKSFSANTQGRRCNLPKSTDGEDPYIICACQFYKSFYLDRMGDPLLEGTAGMIDVSASPAYEQVYLKALPIVEESLNVRVKQVRRCFNCGGDHNLNECPEPKDQQKINMNRAQFSANKANSSPSYSQGNEFELDDRFKHFKPGEISIALEEALDITLKKQLPPWIYRMRTMGYPPAYLKPIEEGLKIFGPDGECLGDPGAEEGEISSVKLPDVISYSGYNASMPEGVRDEADRFNAPPFNPEEADLHIAMKRAQALGYIESAEPLAKRLKYDDMEIADSDSDVDQGSQRTSQSAREKGKVRQQEKKVNGVSVESKSESKKTESKDVKETDKTKSKEVKEIDITTYRNWYSNIPLSSGGITYVMYTPPPTCRFEVKLSDLPKNPITDLDREPWKTASISWYDPLYGDLVAPTGTYDAIRTLLKETKRVKRSSSFQI